MRLRRAVIATVALVALAGPAAAGAGEDGAKALKEKRWADATAAFRKALEASPSRRDAALGLARAAAAGNVADAYEPAAQALHALLKAKGEDREVRLALGDLYLARMAEDTRWRADAQDQFGRLLRADPADDEAAVGMARYFYESGDVPRGLQTLDAGLEKKPASALLSYWKGNLTYEQAKEGFQRAGQAMTPEVRAQFEAALAALEASAKADGTRYDAWIRVGYAAQYLASVDPSKQQTAAAAYRKALDLDGEDDAAMRGLAALYRLDPSGWVEVVDGLAKEKASVPIVLYYHGWSLHQRKRNEEAEKALRAFVKASSRPADGWYELGTVLEEKGDHAGALDAMRKSLEANPGHARWPDATTFLFQPLHEREREAQGSASKAREWLRDAEALLALAPKDISLRNNVAFFCREAYGATKDPVLLDASVRWYVEASALVGEYRPEYEQSLAYRDRHAYAQVLNDTGLMFQYYPSRLDLDKAEAYYRRAQEWTQYGYGDTYGNLMKILTGQQRWREALAFASECAEGLKNVDGTPNENGRAQAKSDAAELEKKVPK